FSKALKVAPNFHPARLNLAAVETADKRYELAIKQFDKILRQAPEDVRAMEGMAKIAELRNRTAEAISWMERIRNIESVAAPPAVLSRLAELYLQTGQPGLALEVANELGNQRPGELIVLELTGRAQLALGELETAARLFRVMHQSGPHSATVLQRIGALLMRSGDLINAEKAIADALQKEPEFLPARGTQVVLEQRLGKTEQALTHARQMRDDKPNLSIGYRLIGDILMESGDFRGAADAYAGGLKVKPENSLLMLQFRAESATGNKKAAWSLLTNWIEKHPNDYLIHNVLGMLSNRAGELEKARVHFEKVVNLLPGHGAAYNNLAMVYSKLKLPEAMEMAQRAYALKPNDPAINDTLGWLLVQSGDSQSSLEYLRQAQARSSKNPEVSYHLAVALHQLKRTDEAVRELKTAIAQGEKFTDYQAAQILLKKIVKSGNSGND
ncbi:MAG: tetratricopeptide repeat protein, partial [bacterium]|nr:tetratricopeptide repeat protein [bacterium]